MELQRSKSGFHYSIGREIGHGTFGTVVRAEATNGPNQGHVYAVKTLKSSRSGPTDLREVQYFMNVPGHKHVVELIEMLYDERLDQVNFVLELMDTTLLDWIRRRGGLSLSPHSVLSATLQILKGVAHIHAHGFVHRDLKPENILVYFKRDKNDVKTSAAIIKIADFGLTRSIEHQPDPLRPWTSYVATRWYRAPEQIAATRFHTPSIDIWAVGTLMVELANLRPLFPGQDMLHMMELHLRALGRPSPTAFGGAWTDGPKILLSYNAEQHKYRGIVHIRQLLLRREYEVFGPLARSLLQWNPHARPTAADAARELQMLNGSSGVWKRAKPAAAPQLHIYTKPDVR